MIDLWGVFSNLLWILGLAVLLATWSYGYYQASRTRQRAGKKFEELGYALALDAGLLLLVAGLAATEHRWWARVIWILLGSAVIVEGAARVVKQRVRR